jgi:hypothetical protein|tara:strand:- start:33 stop:149 length:117 start_codon:yes stop_codon:yes gene_type:complete
VDNNHYAEVVVLDKDHDATPSESNNPMLQDFKNSTQTD